MTRILIPRIVLPQEDQDRQAEARTRCVRRSLWSLLFVSFIRLCSGVEALWTLAARKAGTDLGVDKTGSFDLERPHTFLPLLLYETMSVSHVLSQCMPSIDPAVLSPVQHLILTTVASDLQRCSCVRACVMSPAPARC